MLVPSAQGTPRAPSAGQSPVSYLYIPCSNVGLLVGLGVGKMKVGSTEASDDGSYVGLAVGSKVRLGLGLGVGLAIGSELGLGVWLETLRENDGAIDGK